MSQSDEDERKPSPQGSFPKLQWKDYVALTIAALESTFLPIVIIMLTLIGLTILLVHLAGL